MKKQCIFLAINGLLSLLFLIPTVANAQGGQSRPPGGSSAYNWAPDCSHEGTPLPTPKVNLHRYTHDNSGTPVLGNAGAGSWRGSNSLAEKNMDAATSGNYMLVVSDETNGNVHENSAGAATFLDGFCQLKLRKIDPTSTPNVILDSVNVSDGLRVVSNPRIRLTSNGYYFITWKEHDTGGDQIMFDLYDAALVHYGSGPTSISGTSKLTSIEEYDVTADDQGGIAVVVRANSYEIYARMVDRYEVLNWGATNSFYTLTNATIGSAGALFNPVVNYNQIQQTYEFIWGDNYLGTQGIIVGQTLAGTGATPNEGLTHGGVPNFSLRIPIPSQFYMKTCPGYFTLPATDPGESIILFTDAAHAGALSLYGMILSTGWGGSLLNLKVQSVIAGSTVVADVPCALVIRQISSTLSEPVAIGYSTAGYIISNGDDIITNTRNWQTSATQSLGSLLYESFAGIASGDIFAVIPDNSADYLYRIHIASGVGTLSAGTTLTRRSNTVTAYFAASLGSSKISVFTMQRGSPSALVGAYFATQNEENADNPRENLYGFGTYDYDSYTVNTTGTAFTAHNSIAVEDGVIDHGAHTSVWGTIRATAYEEFDYDGNNRLLLGYRIGLTGNDAVPIVVEAASAGTLFLRPRCAVIYDGTRNIAIVTYEVSTSTTSAYEYQVINLDTRATITAATVLESAVTPSDHFRPSDVVFDPSNIDYLFVYTDQRTTGTVRAAGFSYTGVPLGWTPSTVRTGSSTVKQARACYNPDALNRGAYVTWREGTTGPGIGLTAFATTTGAVWTAGTYMHCPALTSDRSYPVVCAGASWVFVAWEDMQTGGVTPPASRIYGAFHDNAGALLSGWIVNGTILTSSSSTGYEAHEPDVIEDPGYLTQRVALAYTDYTSPTSVNRTVSIKSIQQNGTLGTPVTVGAMPANFAPAFTATNAATSLFGYHQRRPKMILPNASIDIGVPIVGTPRIFLAYETEAYDITANNTYEATRTPKFQQQNISAVLLDGAFNINARYGIARNPNAQDLDGVYWTDDQGFVVGYTDYAGSDNHNGIVKSVDANLEIRDYTDFSSTGYNIAWAGINDTRLFRIYNNSLIDLWVDGGAGSTTCANVPPAANTWTINNLGGSIGPLAAQNVSVTYTPHRGMGLNTDNVTIGLYPSFMHAWLAGEWKVTGAAGTGSYKTTSSSFASERAELQLRLSENPARGASLLQIAGPKGRAADVTVYNLLGQVVLRQHVEATASGTSEAMLEFGSLNSGSYVVNVIGDEGMRAQVMLSVVH
jgi:hypothetical protein